MPITASAGALTYPRSINLGSFQYWLTFINNYNSAIEFAIDSNNDLYWVGTGSLLNSLQIFKFSENNSYPSIVYQSRLTDSTTNFGPSVPYGIEFDSFNNQIKTIGQYQVIGSTFNAGAGFIAPLNISNNTFNTTTIQYPKQYNLKDYPTNGFTDIDFFNSSTSCVVGTDQDSLLTGPQTLFFTRFGSNPAYTYLSSQTQFFGTGIRFLSTEDIAVIGYNNSKIILNKADKNRVLSGSNYYLPPLWTRQLTYTSTTISGAKIIVDNSDNIYLITNTSYGGHILKYNTSGTLQWQRQIAGVILNSLCFDNSGNILVAGFIDLTTDQGFIAKYNTSGSLQYQNKLYSTSLIRINRIRNTGSNMYISTQYGSNNSLIKLPNDGSIPGTGSYYVASNTLTYSISTQTEISGTLTDASTTETWTAPNNVGTNRSLTVTNTTFKRSVYNI